MKNILKKITSSRKIQSILAGIVILLLVGGVGYYFMTENRIFIDNSLVSAPIVTVTPQSAGVLKQMLVSDGQHVKKGDGLAIVGSDTIRAYTDGIVVMTNDAIGSTVAPTTAIAQVVDPTYMRIDGQLDENKGLEKVKVGQPVSFTVDALPGQTFWGYVDEVSSTARQTQISFSISSERPTQQFDIYVHFDASSYPAIKNGMSAKMTVYTK